jgi:hypothetical protein
MHYSATGEDEEEEGRGKRRRDVSCKNCRHPWSEHNYGKSCLLRKRSGLAAPNHRADCGCTEFKEPPKRRRLEKKAA